MDGMKRRWPVGRDTAETPYDTVGKTGGETHCHGLSRNVYPVPPCGTIQIDEGQWESITLSVDEAPAIPPYYVLRFIERIDNSG